jgi:hypothetical protein
MAAFLLPEQQSISRTKPSITEGLNTGARRCNMARNKMRAGQWEFSWNQTTWRDWKGLIATLILLIVITVCGITFGGCVAAINAIHQEAAYGDLNRDCKTIYGQSSFYHSSWNGCVVPGVSKKWCEANGGRQRSLMSRCIIPIR